MPDSYRIAIGGFQHETNTFAPSPATLEAFQQASGWPGLTCGSALFTDVAGINLPIAGFIEAAQGLGHELLPLSWAAATPSALVTRDAFERITGQILEDLVVLMDGSGFDGLYLDLHGAMVTEEFEDGEGEILRRVRAVVGEGLPIVASLDLHANITPDMVALSDALIAYRTYPHIDMAETGARAARHLDRLLSGRAGRCKAFRQLPFLLQLTAGCTMHDPAKCLYAHMADLAVGEVEQMSFACGFGAADIWHCGPSVVAYGRSQAAVEQAATALYDYACAREETFRIPILSPAEGVARGIALSAGGGGPVVLADTQDNPGGGGESDSIGLLQEMIRQDAPAAALAVLYDPMAAQLAHLAGEGAVLSIGLGAGSGWAGERPLVADYRVERLGDGNFTGTGPVYEGARIQLGPMALLRIGDVRVVVASRKIQAADQAIFRHLGVEPAAQRILGLKSSVHFRADFAPIAKEILVVAAPGCNPIDHSALTYRRLRPGLRLMPGGPAFGS